MTAPTATLPAEVQAIVDELAAGPSTLIRHPQPAITTALDMRLIEVAGSGIDTRTLDWRTLYGLRPQPAVAG